MAHKKAFFIVAAMLLINSRLVAAEAVLPADPCVVISRVNGFSLDARDANYAPLTLVQTAGFGQQDNQVWTFNKIERNVYAMKVAKNGICADIRNAGGHGSRLQLGDVNENQQNRQFIVERLPDGFYTLAAKHSKLLLDVVDAGGWNAEVQTAGKQDQIQPNREWLIVPAKIIDDLPVGKAITYDNRVFYKFGLEPLKNRLETAVDGFQIKSIGVGEADKKDVGGLRCDLANEDGEAVIILEPRFWYSPECLIHIELVSTRAYNFLTELGKALSNADDAIRKNLIPPIESKLNDMTKNKLNQHGVSSMKIEVIGIRSDSLVFVSNRLPDEMMPLVQKALAEMKDE